MELDLTITRCFLGIPAKLPNGCAPKNAGIFAPRCRHTNLQVAQARSPKSSCPRRCNHHLYFSAPARFRQSHRRHRSPPRLSRSQQPQVQATACSSSLRLLMHTIADVKSWVDGCGLSVTVTPNHKTNSPTKVYNHTATCPAGRRAELITHLEKKGKTNGADKEPPARANVNSSAPRPDDNLRPPRHLPRFPPSRLDLFCSQPACSQ